MTDLEALAARVESASGADAAIDEAIQAYVAGAEIEWQEHLQRNAYHRNDRWISIGPILPYTASLDAAMTLYVTVPARVPSNPREASAEALRQRLEVK